MNHVMNTFLPVLNDLLQHNIAVTKQNILCPNLRIGRSNNLDMYYTPHNEYINLKAKVVIVGITPGWQQMKIAIEQYNRSKQSGATLAQTLQETKEAAGFSGPMRSNLISMLNACGLPEILGITNTASLFEQDRKLLHTTSLIKYPLFYKGKNYNGYQPPMDKIDILNSYIHDIFPKEMEAIPQKKLIIPLGKAVDMQLQRLLKTNKITNAYCLSGFPHPSGANGHRMQTFNKNLELYKTVISDWFEHADL